MKTHNYDIPPCAKLAAQKCSVGAQGKQTNTMQMVKTEQAEDLMREIDKT